MDSSPDRASNKISPLNSKHPDSQNEFSPFRADTSDNDLRTTDNFVPQDSLEFSAGSNTNQRREKSVDLDPKYQTAPFTLHPGSISFESRNAPQGHYNKRTNQNHYELRTEDLDTVQERSIEQSLTTAKQHNDNENSRAFNSDNFTSERSLVGSRSNDTERHVDKPRNIASTHREASAIYTASDRDYSAKNYQSSEFQTERYKVLEKRRDLAHNADPSNLHVQLDSNRAPESYKIKGSDYSYQGHNNRTQSGGHGHKTSDHLSYSAYKAARANYNPQKEEDNLASSKNHSSLENSQKKSNLSSVSKNERGSAFDLPASDKHGPSEDTSTEFQLLRQQVARLEQKLKAKEDLLNQMKGYHNDLWVSYDHAQKELQQFKSGKDHKTEELRNENKALKQKITELEDSNYLLQKENQESQENYKEQSERFNETIDQNQNLKEEVKALTVRLKKAQADSNSRSRGGNDSISTAKNLDEERLKHKHHEGHEQQKNHQYFDENEAKYQENTRPERTRMAQTTHKKGRNTEDEAQGTGSPEQIRLRLEECYRKTPNCRKKIGILCSS